MKSGKAAGLDDIRTEQIKHLGPLTIIWLVRFLNNCVIKPQIPKIWRKTKVVALLKPGKDPSEPKSYRPISLLCHFFKILERMILNRISPSVDEELIKEQAGFRPGKSCCGQILNLTQHIENGFENKEITGVALVDLSAAYDTINHKTLIQKVYSVTKDYKLANFIKCLHQNRRFQVILNGKNSRWRNQKNGLAQGSVLAPILFNMYTNDQPTNAHTRSFIYADDTALATQANTFELVEQKLENALKDLGKYYENNNLRPNPSKTEVCAFHLKNKKANRKLNIQWKSETLNHNFTPKYLGVTLDRTLSFKKHCQQTKLKVTSRNNLMKKLTNTSWGAKPHVLRTSALALSFSAAEYAAPAWKNSPHAKEVDIALNEAGRIVSGCMQPTPLVKIYPILGIAPPPIRRTVAAEAERAKQLNDRRHLMFNQTPGNKRLRSRKSFLHTTNPLLCSPQERKEQLWKESLQPDPPPDLKENPATGFDLPFTTWRSLNRLRTGVSRCRENLVRWGYAQEEENKCDCGEIQNHSHLLNCSQLELDEPCTQEDLMKANPKAIHVANFWKLKI
ncbi:hypothetical protein M8J77_023748 [Diaphorina citri]|nr:hypothetical protein M8J77_023748 [Diaphorina citri]